MRRYLKVLAALGIVFGWLLGHAPTTSAEPNPVTAIDILLEPDATMVKHAEAKNARLLNRLRRSPSRQRARPFTS